MQKNKQYQVFILLMSLFLVSNNSCAQKNKKPEPLSINVNMIANESGFIHVQQKVLDHFLTALKKNKIQPADYPEWELLLGVKEIDTRQVAISVTTLLALPREIIDITAENEAFYKISNIKKELPKEGASIRHYVTSEYMHQFRMATNNEIHIVAITELPDFCHQFISNFIKNSSHIKM